MAKRLNYLHALALLAGAAIAGEAVQSETLPLRWVALEEAHEDLSPSYVQLDAGGHGEMDFALPSGKLRFQLEPKGLVRIDRNDDGTFDDKDKPLVRPGHPTVVTMRLGDEPFNYRLSVAVSDDQDDRYLEVTSLTALETKEAPARFRLLDADCNGRFGETAKQKDEMGDVLQMGNDSTVPMQKYLASDGKLVCFELVAPGLSLRMTPHKGPVANLTITVKPGFGVTASLEHKESGYQPGVLAGQTTLSLPGAHVITQLALSYSNPLDPDAADGAPLLLHGTAEQPELVLKEGANERTFGPPLKMEFRATRSPSNAAHIEVRDLWLSGATGERYMADNNGEGNESTLECLLRDGAKTVSASKMSYG